jgi:hypothetical protein
MDKINCRLNYQQILVRTKRKVINISNSITKQLKNKIETRNLQRDKEMGTIAGVWETQNRLKRPKVPLTRLPEDRM